ncbi:MAG: hypothetical protein IJ634_07790 [Bacteroidales bacterium]|nr:hypothetical protein [Bacteroidales bacterium]
MKKFLMMAFAAATMLMAVSCGKDDDQKTFSGDTLAGTTWVAHVNENQTQTYEGQTVSFKINATFTMKFITETTGTGSSSGSMSSSFMGQEYTEDITAGPTPFTYTFDGQTMSMTDEDGEIVTLTLNSDKTALVGTMEEFPVSFYLQ